MAVDGGHKTLVVIGGGAAGYFGAIQAAASSTSGLNVIVLEAAKLPLQKVKISGGGRCNVMHDSAKAVSLIAKGYPRGSKQLIGPFKSLFGPEDAAAWFGSRGVRLKTEGDGRMFPVTDDSQTIIDCLEEAAREASVEVVTSARVTSVLKRRAEPAEAGPATDGTDGVEAQPQQQPPRFELEFATFLRALLLEVPLASFGPSSNGMRATVVTVFRWKNTCGYFCFIKGSRYFGFGVSTSTAQPGTLRGRSSCRSRICFLSLHLSSQSLCFSSFLFSAFSPHVSSRFVRLEGLSGLSVQDAELKLFADEKPESSSAAKAGRPAGSRVSAEGEGGVGEDDARPGGAEAAAVAAGNGESAGGGKKKKRKRGKKQAAVTQRGPLLITHTGVSGPAALKLSAFGARVLNESGYRGRLVVNWMAGNNPSKASSALTVRASLHAS
ncbi:HI0933 family protein [Ectocarpus siliculosus]|uniref:HI0933 family protein n=1 Tax=Ectocarpus siliculosus TaxID=2880 RepID=D8LB81_ECTSI|nr:HI0933 family protein [Ectocarpus siliculosus]|eukprot:CBN76590.1 HI0933 family protein [Ectocarpus siliculosus]